jgi:hypothetical protein
VLWLVEVEEEEDVVVVEVEVVVVVGVLLKPSPARRTVWERTMPLPEGG